MEEEKATITLSGEFTAADLEDIIRELATVRSGMGPPVPQEPPPPNSEAELLPQPDALVRIRTRVNGGLRVWLRHAGFGWIPFELGPDEVVQIRDLIGKKLGHTHTAH
jgi:hypothetical protein